MKRISICALALLSIVVLVLVQGCNSKPPVNITGRWAEVDGPDAVEFKSDGSFTGNFVYDADGFQKPISGRYSVDGAKITLTASDDLKASMVWNVADSNGILTVTYKQGGLAKLDGSTAKFHRNN